MNILIIYFGTVGITLIGREINKFLVIKDLARGRLKIDRDLLNEWGSEFKLFNFKKINFEYFIPFYNMYRTLKELGLYLYDHNTVFNELDNLSIIVPMANFEKSEYVENLSVLNLFKVLRNGYKRLHSAKCHSIRDNNGVVIGDVLYEEDDDRINILATYGDSKQMFESEIKSSIREENISKREVDIKELEDLKDELLSANSEKQKVKSK